MLLLIGILIWRHRHLHHEHQSEDFRFRHFRRWRINELCPRMKYEQSSQR